MKTETMESRLLKLLKRKWVTPLTALHEVGCLSLAQRCSEFRRQGIRISDRWLRFNGKRIKQYRIG